MSDPSLHNLDSRLNVVFLIPELPANEVVMLERSRTKKFAPGLWTGIGGRYLPGEAIHEGMRRELSEEIAVTSVFLRELARCYIHTGYRPPEKLIHYFTGLVRPRLPITCNEGRACWVPTAQVLEFPIIPTTRVVVEAWARRNFDGARFTIHLHREDAHQADSPILQVVIGDDLEEILPEISLGR